MNRRHAVRSTVGAARPRSRRGGVSAAIATTLALIVGGIAVAPAANADTAPAPGVEETVSADALPTAQIDGVAWTQAITGNTVWVGGEFTTARPAGSAEGVNTVPRANLMAYDIVTGNMTAWNPGANGAIKTIAASPDGSRIYVGGSFTSIAGKARNRIAAFDATTGALLPWAPYSNAGVTAITTYGDTVYVVGNFSSFGGGVRTRLAAVTASTAALLPLTATLTGGFGVTSIVVDPSGSKLVVAGSFESTNGSTNPGRGMAALDATTGGSLPWAVNSLIRNAGTKSAMTSLASDGDSVYGTGYDYGGGAEDDFEGTFRANWSDGSLVWLEDCHGDNYSVAVSSGVVYTASHDHYCGNIGGFPQTSPTWTFHHSMAFAKDYHGNVLTPDIYGYKSYTGQPAASIVHWYPDWQVGTYTGKSQAAWDVVANDNYVVYGGEFLKVNNKAQQGLVRFAKKAIAPNKSGPQQSGVDFPISATSLRAGEVRLGWTANTDRDNASLTYQVFRQDKGSTPIYITSADSNFWTTPRMTYVDKTAVPGTTYQYRVRAIDPLGNLATGAWTTVTAASTNLATDYSLSVIDDGAIHYWPLGEASGGSGADWTGNSPLTVTSATRNVTGPNLAAPSLATQFSGALRVVRIDDERRVRNGHALDRGVVQNVQHDRRKDRRFRQQVDRQLRQLRPSHLPRWRWSRDLRGLPRRSAHHLHRNGLQQRPVALRRRHAVAERDDPLRRWCPCRYAGRHDLGADLQRLLARRRRHDQWLAERRKCLPERHRLRRRHLQHRSQPGSRGRALDCIRPPVGAAGRAGGCVRQGRVLARTDALLATG